MFEIISNLIAAFFTLAIFSFLYKDNPFYRFSEQLLVGVSAGYAIPLVWQNAFIPFVYEPIFIQHKWYLFVPVAFGLMLTLRFSKNLSWLARYPIAISIGMTGAGVVLSMNAGVLVQMRSAMQPIDSLNMLIIFVGTVTVMLYFYFSKAHTGLYGKFTKIGIWFMMIGFGASFGNTVMARLSLLIGRIQFLINDVIMGFIK
ncbi:MAG: hypothetical protein P9L91_07815 [Candidatus Zophobacter franzmannii]|jgi:hypothetical protein|nr:hypothetical protein [Candidatus Zophobacter franzmannii]